MRANLVFVLISFFYFVGHTQITIQGSVLDEESNPLAFANVVLESKEKGTITDTNGEFFLEMKEAGLIRISYIGYRDTLVSIVKDTVLALKLEPLETVFSCPIILEVPRSFKKYQNFARLDKELLAINPTANISSALNQVPGMYMHSGTFNTNRITIRGIGNRSRFGTSKLRAYLDEIPLTNGVGETTLENINTSILDGVEVFRGPSPSLYGASLGGLLHMQSAQINKSELETNLSFGSYGLLRNSNLIKFSSKNNKTNLLAMQGLSRSDGYRDNNEYKKDDFTLFGNHFFTDKLKASLFINYTDLVAQIPSSLNETDFNQEPEKAAFTWGRVNGFEDNKNWLLGASLWGEIGEKQELSMAGFSSLYTNHELRPFNVLDEESEVFGLRAKYSVRSLDESLALNIGMEYFNERYNWQTFETIDSTTIGEQLSDNKELRNYINLSTSVQKRFDTNHSLDIGVNLNKTWYDYRDLFLDDGNDSGEYAYDFVISPKIGYTYISPRGRLAYTTISHGFSAPTLEETLTPGGTINPEIKPEQGWNFELGLRSDKSRHRFNYDLSVYYMLIRDLLVSKRVDLDQFIGLNAGKTSHAGFEALLEYRLLERSDFSLDAQISYTYSKHKFEDFLDGDLDFSGNDLTGSTPHQISSNLRFTYAGLSCQIALFYQDKVPLRDDNSIYSEAYSVVNLNLIYKREWTKWSLSISGGLNNIFDEHYASMYLINASSFGGNAPRYYYPGLPRNFFGGLKISYLL